MIESKSLPVVKEIFTQQINNHTAQYNYRKNVHVYTVMVFSRLTRISFDKSVNFETFIPASDDDDDDDDVRSGNYMY